MKKISGIVFTAVFALTGFCADCEQAKTGKITLAILGDSLTNCRYQDRLMRRMHEAGYTGYTPVGTHTGFSASDEKRPGEAAHDGFGGFTYGDFIRRFKFAEDELMNVQKDAEYEQMKRLGVAKVEKKDWRRVLLKSPIVRFNNGKKTVDVQAWLDRVNGGKAPDFILIQLGNNGICSMTGDIDGRVRNGQLKDAEELLARLREKCPDAVYGFVSPFPGSEREEDFTRNYKGSITRDGARKSLGRFRELLRMWVEAKKDPKVRFIDLWDKVDPARDYENALHFNGRGAVHIGDALFDSLSAAVR
jgi:lysophospholipase L1-like esterase